MGQLAAALEQWWRARQLVAALEQGQWRRAGERRTGERRKERQRTGLWRQRVGRGNGSDDLW